jgi:hypothetical protein
MFVFDILWIPCWCIPLANGLPEGIKYEWRANIKLNHKEIHCVNGNGVKEMYNMNQSALLAETIFPR